MASISTSHAGTVCHPKRFDTAAASAGSSPERVSATVVGVGGRERDQPTIAPHRRPEVPLGIDGRGRGDDVALPREHPPGGRRWVHPGGRQIDPSRVLGSRGEYARRGAVGRVEGQGPQLGRTPLVEPLDPQTLDQGREVDLQLVRGDVLAHRDPGSLLASLLDDGFDEIRPVELIEEAVGGVGLRALIGAPIDHMEEVAVAIDARGVDAAGAPQDPFTVGGHEQLEGRVDRFVLDRTLDLAEDLRRVRSYEPIQARPAGPVVKLLRWAQRNRIVAAMTLLVAALLIAVATMAAVGYFREVARSASIARELHEEQVDNALAMCDRGDVSAFQ